MVNPRLFFDMTMDGTPVGRIVMEVDAEVVPKTAENFRALCTGEKGFGYKGSPFHVIIHTDMIIAGDFENGDGTGGYSIYGPSFPEENFIKKHDVPFILCMLGGGHGLRYNDSKFFICPEAVPVFNGKQVAFGQVVEGMDVVLKIREEAGAGTGVPTKRVVIENCGQL